MPPEKEKQVHLPFDMLTLGGLNVRSAGTPTPKARIPALLLPALLAASLFGCSLLRSRDDKPIYLRASCVPASDVSAAMEKAAESVRSVEGHPGLLPDHLWVQCDWTGDWGARTELIWYEGGQFGAKIHLSEHNRQNALWHECVHVRRRTNDHDRRYAGKVWEWHD